MHPSAPTSSRDQAAALAALVIPAIRDAVVVTDGQGLITYWNDGASRVFGVSAETVGGRPLIDRLLPCSRAEVPTLIRAMLDGLDWDGECEDVRNDGSRLRLDARVRRLRQP